MYKHDFSRCYHLPPCRPSFSHDPSRHSCGTWRAWDGSSSSILFSSGMKRPQVSSVEATPRTIWGHKPNRINRCSTVPVGYSRKSMLQCGLVMLSMQLNFQVLCSISKTKILNTSHLHTVKSSPKPSNSYNCVVHKFCCAECPRESSGLVFLANLFKLRDLREIGARL